MEFKFPIAGRKEAKPRRVYPIVNASNLADCLRFLRHGCAYRQSISLFCRDALTDFNSVKCTLDMASGIIPEIALLYLRLCQTFHMPVTEKEIR